MILVLSVYGGCFFILGLILMMSLGKVPPNKDPRVRVAQGPAKYRSRVHCDYRVKRHSERVGQYW